MATMRDNGYRLLIFFNLETELCFCPIPTTNKVGISLGTAVRSSSSSPQLCGRKRVLDSMRRRPSRKKPSISRINVGTIDSTESLPKLAHAPQWFQTFKGLD